MTSRDLEWVIMTFINYEKGEKGVDNLSVTAVMTFSFGPSFSHLRFKVEQDNESIIFIDIVLLF